MLKHEFFSANEPVSPKNADKPSVHSDSASVLSGKTLVNDDQKSVKGGKKIASDIASTPLFSLPDDDEKFMKKIEEGKYLGLFRRMLYA